VSRGAGAYFSVIAAELRYAGHKPGTSTSWEEEWPTNGDAYENSESQVTFALRFLSGFSVVRSTWGIAIIDTMWCAPLEGEEWKKQESLTGKAQPRAFCLP